MTKLFNQTVELKETTQMSQIQPKQNPNTISSPIDPSPIVQSASPTAVILAIAILISILLGSITGLIQVILLVKTA
jgi:hypothetical protein